MQVAVYEQSQRDQNASEIACKVQGGGIWVSCDGLLAADLIERPLQVMVAKQECRDIKVLGHAA